MRIRPERSIVLAIDLQERLLATLLPEERQKLLLQARKVLEAASHLGIPRLACAQYPQGLGPVDAGITGLCEDQLEKTQFSCPRNPEIREWLDSRPERRQVWILGLEAHICVLQTALELKSLGWEPVVLEDVVASRDPRNRESAFRRLWQAGVTTTTSEAVFYEALGDATHPAFRQLAPHWR